MTTLRDRREDRDDADARVAPIVWWGRLATLLAIGAYTLAIIASRLTDPPTLLHLTVILFHEAGHVVFAPFGETIRVAGGTLGQLLMPLACAVALLRRKDRFGAAIAFTWSGLSLVDAAVYAFDAAEPVLPLIGGGTGADGFHDFIFLFDRFDQLDHARAWARAMKALGASVALASLARAGFVLRCQSRRK